jgi:GTP-binding protein
MNFVDDVKLKIIAGKGGDGAVHFRREKFVPRGGPDGGDGGNGGSVIVQATNSLQTMADLAGLNLIKAEPGKNGGPQLKSGHAGHDEIIKVPLGTVVIDVETEKTIGDLTTEGQQFVAAKGGRGGKGNWHFRSATNQAPEEFQPGTIGGKGEIRLQLQLLADAGLIGLPNAGKSSLLNRLTSAQARIGAYPFTTVNPNLGVLRLNDRDIVLADIPGLIEGAAEGRGLGHRFLKHVQRCRVLIHCIAADNADLVATYNTVRQELAAYHPDLVEKPEIVVINKIDLVALDELAKLSATMRSAAGQEPILTSAVTGKGLESLRERITQLSI